MSQDRPADEIIVVDDASTDNSLEIIERYAEKHPCIQILRSPKNIGVIGALTRGLNAASKKYVYFGAADDFVLPGFFSTGLDALNANSKAGLFCGEMILIDGNSGDFLDVRPPVRPRYTAGFIPPAQFSRLLRHNDNFILTGAALLNRDAALEAGGFDENLSTFADAYLVRKIAFSRGIYYMPRACLTWCIFPDSVSRTTSTQLDRTKAVFTAIQSRMTTDPIFPNWYWEVFARRWRFSLCRLAVQNTPINSDILMDLGVRNAADRTLFISAMNGFGAGLARFIILFWLWLRFRPFSLFGLISTAIARRLEPRLNRRSLSQPAALPD